MFFNIFDDYNKINEAYSSICEGRKAEASVYKEDGYDQFGVNKDGLFRDGTTAPWCFPDEAKKLNPRQMASIRQAARMRENTVVRKMNGGFDSNGFDREGFNKHGFDKDGFSREGFNKHGIDRNGFNRKGYNAEGFDVNGFDRYGYNSDGRDSEGRDEWGFDREGRDAEGFPAPWLNPSAYGLNSQEEVEQWKSYWLERIRDKKRGGTKFKAERDKAENERKERAKEFARKWKEVTKAQKKADKEKAKADREAYLKTDAGQQELAQIRAERARKQKEYRQAHPEVQKKASEYAKEYAKVMYILGAKMYEGGLSTDDRIFLAMSPVYKEFMANNAKRKEKGLQPIDPCEWVRKHRESARKVSSRKFNALSPEEKQAVFQNLRKYNKKPSDGENN